MDEHLRRDIFQPLANVSRDDRHLVAAASTKTLRFGNVDHLDFTRKALWKTGFLASLATLVGDFDLFDVCVGIVVVCFLDLIEE